MSQFYKNMAKRVLKKKPTSSDNAFDDIVDKPSYMSDKRKLSRKEKKERDELIEKFKEDYTSYESPKSNLDFDSEDDISEFIEDQIAFDSNFGDAPRKIASNNSGLSGLSKGPGFFKNSVTGEIVKIPTVAMDSIPNSGFAGTGINSGNQPLEELTQITLYGTLAEDLSMIDPSTVEVLDSDSSKLAMQINSLVQNKEPFVIKNQYEDGQKILVKFNEFGGYNLFVKDEITGKYKPATETNFNNNEYEAFYKNVQKAFNQNFIAKFTK